MKRSKLLLTGAIVGTAYLVYLGVIAYTLLSGMDQLPQTAYIFGQPIEFRWLALHALGLALATILGWAAYGTSGGALAIASIALCAASGACAPLLSAFVAPEAAFMLAGFIGLRRYRAARKRQTPPPVEPTMTGSAAVAPVASVPAPRAEEKEMDSRADPITIIMTSLCVLVVAAVVCVVLYGLSIAPTEPASAPPVEDDLEDDLEEDPGDEVYSDDSGDDEYTGEDEEDPEGEDENYDDEEYEDVDFNPQAGAGLLPNMDLLAP